MRRVYFLLIVVVSPLFSCTRSDGSGEDRVVVLSVAESGVSKAGSLTAGDEVAVFARIEGTERYFIETAKFTAGPDGTTLSATPAVHYPEAKQAVTFYAYLPYHTGNFSVPNDQSTAEALKKADLCWATGSSTPVSTGVPLSFEHRMARLVVSANEPIERLTVPNVSVGGTLDIRTGVFANTTQGEVSTTGGELILPAQTLNRLILTVANIEYVFDGSISLLTGQTTTLNLTLHPSTQTATLSGSSTTNWTTTLATGATTQSVLNTLKLYWPNVATQASTVNKMILTIQDLTDRTTADYTVQSGIAYADGVFTLPFSSSVLHYPYQITQIRSYASTTEVLPMVNVFSGPMVYKSGVQTVGVLRNPINPPAPSDYVKIGNLYWAKGNLVATSSTASGSNGCKVGAPTDGGLYFQFASLIGYKGGNQANGGTGVGMPQFPLTNDGTYWNGSGYSWSSDAMVWPSELVGTKTSWRNTTGSNIATLSDYYFNYSVAPWATQGQNIREFNVSISGDSGLGTLASGRYATKGVGDPCTYYLGGSWRLPTSAEYATMCNNKTAINKWYTWSEVGGSWTTSPTYGGNFSSNQLFFPASGYRYTSNGSFYRVTTHGYYWSSSVGSATGGYILAFDQQPNGVVPQSNTPRLEGFPVRCVSSVP